jgi:hypothetical protein
MLAPLNQAMSFSFRVCGWVCRKVETSRKEIERKMIVSYNVITMPEDLAYDLTLLMMHCGGSTKEMALPAKRLVIDVATTASHKIPNITVMRRPPPYIARTRNKKRKAVAERLMV